MKKREFTLKVTFSLPSPSSMLKLPFYYILSTFNSKMDAENSLLELEAVKSLLSIKPPAGNENQIFQRKKLQKYIAQRFKENQAALKSKFILTSPLTK